MIRFLPLLLLAGCATPAPIIRDRVSEVKVPVVAPCRSGERPTEPVSVRDRLPRAEWDALSTDQRENLLQAQALDRKAFGDKLVVNTAGCP